MTSHLPMAHVKLEVNRKVLDMSSLGVINFKLYHPSSFSPLQMAYTWHQGGLLMMTFAKNVQFLREETLNYKMVATDDF